MEMSLGLESPSKVKSFQKEEHGYPKMVYYLTHLQLTKWTNGLQQSILMLKKDKSLERKKKKQKKLIKMLKLLIRLLKLKNWHMKKNKLF